MATPVIITSTTILACGVVTILWLYILKPKKVLKSLGVPVIPGALPFVGNIHQVFHSEHAGMYDLQCIKKHGRIFGMIEFTQPAITIADPDLLREVLVKQFNNFQDRRSLPVRGWMRFSLFDQKGDDWKRIRVLLTPFFSTGKLKHSVQLMQQPIRSLVSKVEKIAESGGDFEAYELCGAFAMDIICSTAFGLQVDSQNNPKNQFVTQMRRLVTLSLATPIFFVSFMFPFLSPMFDTLGLTMFPSGFLRFFERVTKNAIAQRKQSNDWTSPDFIDAMIKAGKDQQEYESKTSHGGSARHKGLTEKEVMAQSLLFLLAGHDTTTMSLSMFLYVLALHPDVQDKIRDEISIVLQNEIPSYENISRLEYLDMCLSESLRVYPPVYRFDRETVQDADVNGLFVPRNTIVDVPVWALHHDPDFWENPEQYNPERFSSEHKNSINPFTYLPFGYGSRNCIGSRFALIEIKLFITNVLKSMRVTTNNRTEIPLQLENNMFLRAKNGIYLSFVKC